MAVPWKTVPFISLRHEGVDKKDPVIVVHPDDHTDGAIPACQRVYYIIHMEGEEVAIRGGHSHPDGGKQEILIVLVGSAAVRLHSKDGCGSVTLDNPTIGLFIPTGVWHQVEMQPHSILLSVTSTKLDPNENITELPCSCQV